MRSNYLVALIGKALFPPEVWTETAGILGSPSLAGSLLEGYAVCTSLQAPSGSSEWPEPKQSMLLRTKIGQVD